MKSRRLFLIMIKTVVDRSSAKRKKLEVIGNVRLYELAKTLKINSKALVTCCQDLGSPVKNHMSVVSEEVWNAIQDRLKIPADRGRHHLRRRADLEYQATP